jgi:hypothetical protein
MVAEQSPATKYVARAEVTALTSLASSKPQQATGFVTDLQDPADVWSRSEFYREQ